MERKTTMSKATQRRERQLAKDLQALSIQNPKRFIDVWHCYLTGWCEEIVSRGRSLKRGAPRVSLRSVSAIREKAERLLSAIGSDAEHMVGERTREILGHECSKAIASATDPRIYLFDANIVHRLMMSRPKVKKRS
jgi:hypothetical protein